MQNREKQKKIAEKELKAASKQFKKSRRTKLVRIREDLHEKLKTEAKNEKKTLSKLLDTILVPYFKSSNAKNKQKQDNF